MRTLPKVGITSAQDEASFEKLQKAKNNVAKQLFGRNQNDLAPERQLFVSTVLRAKIDKGQKDEFKEHSEFGKEAARQIAIDHLAESADNYPLTHGMSHKAKKGWRGEGARHSLSAKGIKTGKKKKYYYIPEPYGLPFELTEKNKFKLLPSHKKHYADKWYWGKERFKKNQKKG